MDVGLREEVPILEDVSCSNEEAFPPISMFTTFLVARRGGGIYTDPHKLCRVA